MLLTLALFAAAGVTACGSSADSNAIAAYLGAWQRVEGGEADPQKVLLVERQDGAARTTFSDLTTGFTAGGVATLEDGYLALDLPGRQRPADPPACSSAWMPTASSWSTRS